MSNLTEIMERARLAQLEHERRIDIQLELDLTNPEMYDRVRDSEILRKQLRRDTPNRIKELV